jgi:hypothetical protein
VAFKPVDERLSKVATTNLSVSSLRETLERKFSSPKEIGTLVGKQISQVPTNFQSTYNGKAKDIRGPPIRII